MDTFSGLNQGRMGMDFCTQFWSEYASLPTGYSWVACGAVLSVQGVKEFEWATHVLPLCLLMALTWQFLGTTLGAYKILKANANELFWKNREKWETVQHFYKLGVQATKQGWENDCFCLHLKGVACNVEDGMESLFSKIQPTQVNFTNKILSPNGNVVTVKERKITSKTFKNERSRLRSEHWDKLKEYYFDTELEGTLQVKEKYRNRNYFITFKPLHDRTDRNDWRKGKYQLLLVLAAMILGYYSYLAIGRVVETEDAVLEGFSVLKDVSLSQWYAFALYNIVVLVYYHTSVMNSIYTSCSFIHSVLFCKWCRASNNLYLETTFKIMDKPKPKRDNQ